MRSDRLSIPFEMLGANLLFESDDRDSILWLESFLRPWFAETPPQTCTRTVRLLHDAEAFEALETESRASDLQPTDCFTLDTKVLRLPAWRRPGATCIADRDLGCFLVHSGPVTTVLARPGNRLPRLAIVRILRELALAHGTRGLGLHAAALETQGQAILLAGPKRSGKTSLLLHLLLQGQTRWIANDWSIVTRDQQSPRPQVHGMPTVIRIRRTTADWLPSLAQQLTQADSFLSHPDEAPMPPAIDASEKADSCYFGPLQFTQRLQTQAVRQAPLAAIWLPSITPQVEGIELRRLEPAAALHRLQPCVYGHGNGPTAGTLFGNLPSSSQQDLLELVQQVPIFECQLGRQAYQRRVALHSGLDLWMEHALA